MAPPHPALRCLTVIQSQGQTAINSLTEALSLDTFPPHTEGADSPRDPFAVQKAVLHKPLGKLTAILAKFATYDNFTVFLIHFGSGALERCGTEVFRLEFEHLSGPVRESRDILKDLAKPTPNQVRFPDLVDAFVAALSSVKANIYSLHSLNIHPRDWITNGNTPSHPEPLAAIVPPGRPRGHPPSSLQVRHDPTQRPSSIDTRRNAALSGSAIESDSDSSTNRGRGDPPLPARPTLNRSTSAQSAPGSISTEREPLRGRARQPTNRGLNLDGTDDSDLVSVSSLEFNSPTEDRSISTAVSLSVHLHYETEASRQGADIEIVSDTSDSESEYIILTPSESVASRPSSPVQATATPSSVFPSEQAINDTQDRELRLVRVPLAEDPDSYTIQFEYPSSPLQDSLPAQISAQNKSVMPTMSTAEGRRSGLRYSIETLTSIRETSAHEVDINKFSSDAIRDGIVVLSGTGRNALSEVSANRTRGLSVASMGSNEECVIFSGSHRSYPRRQPSNAPRTGLAQVDAGFARFLKEHASPTHHRVTAGGRIVPMESQNAPPEFKLQINNLSHGGINPSSRNIQGTDSLAKQPLPGGNDTTDGGSRATALTATSNVGVAGSYSVSGEIGNYVAAQAARFGPSPSNAPRVPHGDTNGTAYSRPWMSDFYHPQVLLSALQPVDQGQAQAQAPQPLTSPVLSAPFPAPVSAQGGFGGFGDGRPAMPQLVAPHYAPAVPRCTAYGPGADPRLFDPRFWHLGVDPLQVPYPNLAPGAVQPQQAAVQPVHTMAPGMTSLYTQPMTAHQMPTPVLYSPPMMISSPVAHPYAPGIGFGGFGHTEIQPSKDVSQESLDAARREFHRLSDSLDNLDRHLAVNGPKIDPVLKSVYTGQRMDLVVRRATAKQDMDRLEAQLKADRSHSVATNEANPHPNPAVASPQDLEQQPRISHALNVEAPAFTPEEIASNGSPRQAHSQQVTPPSKPGNALAATVVDAEEEQSPGCWASGPDAATVFSGSILSPIPETVWSDAQAPSTPARTRKDVDWLPTPEWATREMLIPRQLEDIRDGGTTEVGLEAVQDLSATKQPELEAAPQTNGVTSKVSSARFKTQEELEAERPLPIDCCVTTWNPTSQVEEDKYEEDEDGFPIRKGAQWQHYSDYEMRMDAKRQHRGVVSHIGAYAPCIDDEVEGQDLPAPQGPLNNEWERRYWTKYPDSVFWKRPDLRAIPGQHLFTGTKKVPRRAEDDICSVYSEDSNNPVLEGDERDIAHNEMVDRLIAAGIEEPPEPFSEQRWKELREWQADLYEEKKYRPSKKCLKHAGRRIFADEAAMIEAELKRKKTAPIDPEPFDPMTTLDENFDPNTAFDDEEKYPITAWVVEEEDPLRHKSPSSVAAQTVNAYGVMPSMDGAADALQPLSIQANTANAGSSGDNRGLQANQGQATPGNWLQSNRRDNAQEHSREQVRRFFQTLRKEEDQALAKYKADNPM